jgi:small neutral amino acid transporter SnatA (MarC family)
MLLGIVPHGTLAGSRFLGQTGINVITRIMGLLLMALGLNSSLPVLKHFPRFAALNFV